MDVSSKLIAERNGMSEAEKWKFVFDNTTKLTAVGFLVGSSISYVALRSVAARVGVTSFAAGVGLGRAYIDARFTFGHDVSHQKYLAKEI